MREYPQYGACLFDFDGKLAYFRFVTVNWDRPVRQAHIELSNIPVSEWPELLGKALWFAGGHGPIGETLNPRRTVDMSGWESRVVEENIARPKDGKEYTWVWSCGSWAKNPFPRCPECRKYHDPKLPYCEDCGRCHKIGAKCA